MRKVFLFQLLIPVLLNISYSQTSTSATMEQIGTSMANFLKIGVGAREVGMGGAAVADCDNASSLYWNPGALDRMQRSEILFQQTQWLVTFPEGTGRTFSTYDMAIGLTYSRNIIDRFSAGITVKYIQEGLDREKASTLAIDIGSVFETNFLNNMKIGMSLSNLGGNMKLSGSDLQVQYSPNPGFPTKVTTADLSTEEWDIPMYFRLGIATDVIQGEPLNWRITAEVMDSRDYIHRISLGTELGFLGNYFLRGGYKFMYDEENLTLGAGANIELSWVEVRLDYAYASFGVFDNTQRFSLIFAY